MSRNLTMPLAIAAEAIILLLVGTAFIMLSATGHETFLVIVLSFIMGLQNAVTTMISRARVRTTHVSGMATDIGIELAALVGDEKARQDATPKLWLHSLTLACFTFGGLCGALLFQFVGNWIFIIAATLLLLIAVPEVFRAHRSTPATGGGAQFWVRFPVIEDLPAIHDV